MEEEIPSIGNGKPGSSKKRSRFQFNSGKRKRRSIADDDAYNETSEPIDTLYRILCPSKKIGSVLGKGGDIINSLRDETRSKIRVSDPVPGCEERMIVIYSYCSDNDQESEMLNSNAEDENLRPHCPAQHALLKVHDRIAADEYLRGGVIHGRSNEDDEVVARILVPGNQVGCLIGKGGTVIQKLRSETTAGIRVLSVEHLPPCAMRTDELVQITGKPAIVKKALYEVSTMLHMHPHKENPPLGDLMYGNSRGGATDAPFLSSHERGGFPWAVDQYPASRFGPPVPWYPERRNQPPLYPPRSSRDIYTRKNSESTEEFSMKVLCPSDKIGGVIGKNGTSVRLLEEQTGARILVEDADSEAAERVILISSKEAPWNSHSPTIEAVLHLLGRTNAIPDKGVSTIRLLVPSGKVGCLIGQGGDIINEMRLRTNAEIRVFSKTDKPNYIPANEELVQISGDYSVATEALSEVASRLRTRTLQGSSAAFVPYAPLDWHSWKGPQSSSVTKYESAVPYEPFKSIRSPYEAPGYHGVPDGSGYPSSPSRYGYAGTQYSSGYPNLRSGYAPTDVPTGTGYGGQLSSPGFSGYQNFSGVSNHAVMPPAPASNSYHPPPSGYQGSPARTGYANIISYEMKIPSSAMASVLGSGGTNLSEIRQISGARVLVHDPMPGDSDCIVQIHGTAEQTKAAQSLLQAFLSSGPKGPLPLPPTQPPLEPHVY